MTESAPQTIDELVSTLRAERPDWNPDVVLLAGAANIVERLRKQLADALTEAGQQGLDLQEARAEVERVTARLTDWEDSARRAYKKPCGRDERHCTCVPLLRRRVEELEAIASREGPGCLECSHSDVLALTARVEAHNKARQSAEQRELAAIADLDETRAEVVRLCARVVELEVDRLARATEINSRLDALIVETPKTIERARSEERERCRTRVAELESQLQQAREELGEGWLVGGASLAEGIRRKVARLEESING